MNLFSALLLAALLASASVAAQSPAPSPAADAQAVVDEPALDDEQALDESAVDESAVLDDEQAILEEEARLDAEENGVAPGLGAGRLATPRDPTAPDPAPVHPELRATFDAFGGEAGLTALMETFMTGLLADARMAPFFAETDQARIKRQLVLQFCAILGGGCEYTGADMKSSHAGLRVDRADFNALVEVLQIAMDAHDIPFAAQNRLLATLAPMHREVVTE